MVGFASTATHPLYCTLNPAAAIPQGTFNPTHPREINQKRKQNQNSFNISPSVLAPLLEGPGCILNHDPERCSRDTRRLKQQRCADAASASKTPATNYVWCMGKIKWPRTDAGLVVRAERAGGRRAGIGRMRFTFLSGDVIPRQGHTKASARETRR